MSTAAAWDTLPVQSPTSRPRLVVIDGGAAEEAGRPAALVVPRWVRLALTLSVAAVLVTMLLGVGGAGAASAPLGSVEVGSGQTLSEIAVAELPGYLGFATIPGDVCAAAAAATSPAAAETPQQ